jgi:hypothetical protein
MVWFLVVQLRVGCGMMTGKGLDRARWGLAITARDADWRNGRVQQMPTSRVHHASGVGG